MENMASKRERRLTLGFLAAVFVFMFVFFYNIHPLVILDADDWTYVSYSRMALPSARYWNPSRILPELLMSGCSNFAVFALLPLMHDYIRALSLVYALVLSLFITDIHGASCAFLSGGSGLSACGVCLPRRSSLSSTFSSSARRAAATPTCSARAT